jgi:hypothetical protein
MFVKVTGGMSRAVGALKPLAELLEAEKSPDRTIGDCKSVEIAFWLDPANEV